MAQLKNTEIDDTGSLRLPAGSTAQRPGSPAAGMIRYNTTINDTEYYNGATWLLISDSDIKPPEATGGTVVDIDIGGVPYRIHMFTSTGNSTFTVTEGGEVECLIVAGGGGGGASDGGGASAAGGGAGGLIQQNVTVSAQSYSITVGTGGNGGNGGTDDPGDNGGNSSAFGFTAIGGGGGGGRDGSGQAPAKDGGSGGGEGSQRYSNAFGEALQPASASGGFGNDGGSVSSSDSSNNTGAGGGGAGAVGGNAQDGKFAGEGGPGLNYSTLFGLGFGESGFFAGGGGGGTSDNYGGTNNTPPGGGGLGGGGNGGRGDASVTIAAQNGKPNTGGGGGGAGGSNGAADGGIGGSGIVLIRYRRNASTATNPDRTIITTQPNNYQTVKDGLVMDLDAASPVSYIGSGTTWRDLSGIANNGSLQNGVSFADVNGGVFVFDGSNDYVSMGKSYIASGEIGSGDINYTLEAWVKLQGTPAGTTTSGMSIIGSASSSGIGFQLTTVSGNVRVNFGARSTSNFNSSGTINQNEWYHIVCTRQVGANNRIYINGVLDSTYGISNLTVQNTGNEMQIGYAAGRITDYFQGQISIARLYNTFLTDEQVLQNFNANRWRFGI